LRQPTMESLRSSLPLNRLLPGNQSPQRFLLALLRRRGQLPRTLSRIVINRRQLLVLLRQSLPKGQRHNLRRKQLSPRNLQPSLLLQRPDRRQLLLLLQRSLPKGQRHNLRPNQHNHQPSLPRLRRSPPQLSGLRNRHNRPRVSNQLNLRNHQPSLPRLRRSPPQLSGQHNRHNRPRVSNHRIPRPLNPNQPRSQKPSLRLSLPLRSRRNARRPKQSTKLLRQRKRSHQRTSRSRSNSSFRGQTLEQIRELAKPELRRNTCLDWPGFIFEPKV
jgi:hypothetical protein